MTIILDTLNILIENTYFFVNLFFENNENSNKNEIEITNIIKGDDL
jgi:hypothetical protein